MKGYHELFFRYFTVQKGPPFCESRRSIKIKTAVKILQYRIIPFVSRLDEGIEKCSVETLMLHQGVYLRFLSIRVWFLYFRGLLPRREVPTRRPKSFNEVRNDFRF